MNMQWLIAPVMGGVIGLITNGIAIKMLFRPLKPIRIGRFTVPFTPGLIPKEKERIARSLGTVISKELLSSEVFSSALKSRMIQDKLMSLIDRLVLKALNSEYTVKQQLDLIFSAEVADELIAEIQKDAGKMIESQLESFEFGEGIVKEALTKHFEDEKGLLSRIMDEKMIAGLSKSLGKMLNKAISSNAHSIVSSLVEEETEKLLEMRIAKLGKYAQNKLPSFKAMVLVKYNDLIDRDLSRILNTVDIAGIVEERINSFDLEELERLIMSIIHKELNAIVYLGGLLGVIMGMISGLIS